MRDYCPQCRPRVELIDGECPDCAWMPPKSGRRDRGKGGKPGLCEHMYSGQRCPMPGNLSDNTRDGGPWYCRHHDKPANRAPDIAQHAFFDACREPDAVKTQTREWYPPENSTLVELESLMAENLEWHRGEHESSSVYRKRMSELCRGMLAGVMRGNERNRTGEAAE